MNSYSLDIVASAKALSEHMIEKSTKLQNWNICF